MQRLKRAFEIPTKKIPVETDKGLKEIVVTELPPSDNMLFGKLLKKHAFQPNSTIIGSGKNSPHELEIEEETGKKKVNFTLSHNLIQIPSEKNPSKIRYYVLENFAFAKGGNGILFRVRGMYELKEDGRVFYKSHPHRVLKFEINREIADEENKLAAQKKQPNVLFNKSLEQLVAEKLVKMTLSEENKLSHTEKELQLTKEGIPDLKTKKGSNATNLSMYYIESISLHDFIQQKRNLNPENNLIIIYNILYNLQQLHNKNIVHNDLKPKNILIDNFNQILIIDLGLSHHLHKEPNHVGKGTDGYRSPEQSNKQITNQMTDVYSIAITLAEFLNIPKVVNQGRITLFYDEPQSLLKHYPKEIQEKIKTLLQDMTNINPEKRISLADAIKTVEMIMDLNTKSKMEKKEENSLDYINNLAQKARDLLKQEIILYRS